MECRFSQSSNEIDPPIDFFADLGDHHTSITLHPGKHYQCNTILLREPVYFSVT
jgi:hypothetical protein